MKLYGVPFSNYYNVAKLGLLEKGLEFQEIQAGPSQEDPFLNLSITGKIPALETPEGNLCESLAILMYLERHKPDPSLFPKEAFKAGQAMQLHLFLDLSIDSSSRRLLPAAFFGKEADPAKIEKVAQDMKLKAERLKRIFKPDPYLVGEFSHADIAFAATLPLTRNILKIFKLDDPFSEIPGLLDYVARLKERPSVAKMLDDIKQAMAAREASKNS